MQTGRCHLVAAPWWQFADRPTSGTLTAQCVKQQHNVTEACCMYLSIPYLMEYPQQQQVKACMLGGSCHDHKPARPPATAS
jgi:hypothetical protein